MTGKGPYLAGLVLAMFFFLIWILVYRDPFSAFIASMITLGVIFGAGHMIGWAINRYMRWEATRKRR
jgi:hypothetical protein